MSSLLRRSWSRRRCWVTWSTPWEPASCGRQEAIQSHEHQNVYHLPLSLSWSTLSSRPLTLYLFSSCLISIFFSVALTLSLSLSSPFFYHYFSFLKLSSSHCLLPPLFSRSNYIKYPIENPSLLLILLSSSLSLPPHSFIFSTNLVKDLLVSILKFLGKSITDLLLNWLS